MTNYQDMKAKELRDLAQEAKVPNYWNLKKAELISELEKLNQPQEREEVKITELEKIMILEIREDPFLDEEDDSIWIDTFLDETTHLEINTAKGVLGSLVKKELLYIGEETIRLSPKGIKVLHTINGEEEVNLVVSPEKKKVISNKEVSNKEVSKEVEIKEVEIKEEDLVTIKDLAYDLNMREGKIRRILRSKEEVEKNSGRWEWSKDSKQLELVKTILSKYTK